ncbi:hypothetical protein SAMN05878482_101852 [Peribacillus simplex]|uniref:Uncharacterized protein n=1 Tax=Peribacillus simplex TaxID=1478 RepID=A0A9X8R419_9BACI|nr:hypothetical protein [Peribacillus simplex]SIQ29140.1 hypothetical protein SAMN05878482_101852 [Peribacillus simplex]
MVEKDHLEIIQGKNELIIGIEGERILRGKQFYTVFMTPEEYDVLEGIRKIGNVILAGKLWIIKDIDTDKNKVYVSKAVNVKPPLYLGSGGMLHKKIGEKMMEIVCCDQTVTYTNDEAANTLRDMRRKYQEFGFHTKQRPIWEMKNETIFETFTGTTITRTLC